VSAFDPNEVHVQSTVIISDVSLRRLRDESAAVRKCTLIVMTRLILNDMVKVKGQISEIAVCLVDEEHQIRQLAMQFFSELANKVGLKTNPPLSQRGKVVPLLLLFLPFP